MPLPHYTYNFNNKSHKRRKKIIKLLKFEILNKFIKEL